MKPINSICLALVFSFLVSGSFALDKEARFKAKEKEDVLSITNYQKEREEKAKQEKARAEEEAKLRAMQDKEEREKERKRLARIRAEQKRAEAEKERLARLEKQEQEAKRLEEEKRRNRRSSIKLVKQGDVNIVRLNKGDNDLKEQSYSYSLGTDEDTIGFATSRDNIVTRDRNIKLLTESNINSRRGGDFNAVVERDVYSFESTKVLIPRGTKFICSFEPLNAYGETALNASCIRAYFPDGRSFLMSEGMLKDAMGRNGLSGELDNRVWEKYGQTFGLTLLSATAMVGADNVSSDSSTTKDFANYTALSILDVATEVLDKTIDLSPIVIIPSGSRIILKPQVDINLVAEEE